MFVTGGALRGPETYSPRRADRDLLLAIPTSCERVAAYNQAG